MEQWYGAPHIVGKAPLHAIEDCSAMPATRLLAPTPSGSLVLSLLGYPQMEGAALQATAKCLFHWGGGRSMKEPKCLSRCDSG